jgi:hypothetical protein
MSVSRTFALDQTNTVVSLSLPLSPPSLPVAIGDIYVVNAETGDIWALDATGCQCRLVVNATALMSVTNNTGLPPNSLTVDQDRIYWSSDVLRVMNSVNKRSGLISLRKVLRLLETS